MGTITVPFTNEAEWQACRAKDVTSTEVSALYGLSPYITEFELWHQKRSGVVVRPHEDDRIRWGKRLEEAIAYGVAEDQRWKIRRMSEYMRLPSERLGCSFDFAIEADEPGILEVKNVDDIQFIRAWDEDRGAIVAPPHIEIQLQAQLAVSDRGWGCIVVLVGGNDAKVAVRKRDNKIAADLVMRTRLFWKSIEEGREPKPDFDLDHDFITKHLRRIANAGETITADPELEELVMLCQKAAEARREAEANYEAAKAAVFMRAGTASKVVMQQGTLTCSTTNDVVGKPITQEMVGQIVGARAGYRQFRFTPKEKS